MDTEAETAPASVVEKRGGAPASPFRPGAFGPAVADQLAALIARHWREARRAGEIDAAQYVDVIDLCPGNGQSGRMLCAAISRRLDGLDTIRFRYLPVLPESIALAFPCGADSPSSAVWRRLSWNLADPDCLPQLQDCDTPYRAANPVVLLAHDAWSRLPQQLYAAHYGKLLRARLEDIGSGDGKQQNDNLWANAEPEEWGDELQPLLRRYLQEFNSSPVVFPSTGIGVVGKLLDLSAGRALVISIGDGHSHERKLRLTSFADVIGGYRQSGELPVNFQLFAEWMRARGGDVVDVDLSSGETLQLQLSCSDASCQRLQAISRCIDSALFSSSHHLVEACKNLGSSVSLATRLNLLQMSRHDPEVFAAEDRGILLALSKGSDFDRDAWRRSLEKVWENHLMFPLDDTLHRRIAAVAMHCSHWGFARTVLRRGMQNLGENANDLANLAWCEIRTGKLGLGKQLVMKALAMDASSSLALEIEKRVSERAAMRDSQWLVELRHESLPLVLEPLDNSHAEAYCRQYRDPQIAVMTGLPALKSVDEVRTWIREQDKEKGRVNFAVMHRDWGLVGFINLAVSEHAAFFCFWTGIDFQGAGFATAAGRLACAHAASQGVPVMLTSAYKDNHRSIRALRRIGFEEMAIRACPPDQDRIFFSLIDQSAGSVDVSDELVNYYAREKLPMQFEGRSNSATGSEVGGTTS